MKKLRLWIDRVAGVIEIVVSVLILVAIVLSIFSLLQDYGAIANESGSIDLSLFLNHALLLVVGVEFIKMVIRHSPGSAIEVLLYAITRQLIIAHGSIWETLIGVAALAGIFAIRRFLFVHSFEEEGEQLFEEPTPPTELSGELPGQRP